MTKTDAYLESLRSIAETQAGRDVIRHIIFVMAHVNIMSLTADPHITAANEGARSVGIALTNHLCDVAPNLYIQLLKEEIESHDRDSNSPSDRAADAILTG